jgi:hypothetical protein
MDLYLEKNLLHACRILFGRQVSVNRDFLFYIQIQGVKSAFRKKAFITHPDRAVLSGCTEKNTVNFIEALSAYKQLVNFIDKRERGVYSSATKTDRVQPREPVRKNHDTGHNKRYYSGSMPRRPLLFAEYLYYSGIITWESLLQAIVWQQRKKSRFGEVACRLRYLSNEQIRKIIKKRRVKEKIGDAAFRMNFLNRFQVQSILWHQTVSQKRIGMYFVETGIFTSEKLHELLFSHRRYNSGKINNYKKNNL